MIRIDGISVKAGDTPDFEGLALRALHIRKQDIVKTVLLKRSLDCRKKPDLYHVYSLGAEVRGDENRIVRACRNAKVRVAEAPVDSLEDYLSRIGAPKGALSGKKIAVVGSGPAGLFAALTLAYLGAKPVVIERGSNVEERTAKVERFFAGGELDEECNVQFGEGGAGTFSDGKLNTGIGGGTAAAVVAEFAKNGGGEELKYENKPHIGTDLLPVVVAGIRLKIIAMGGEFYFNTKVTDIGVRGGKLTSLTLEGERSGVLETERAILAVGHSARDVYETLYMRGVDMTSKPFAVGVRIEHLQKDVNFAQYGAVRSDLPAADYKFAAQVEGRGCYTFCMCPGGEVVAAASEKGGCVVNGMSNRARSGENANSALIVTVNSADFGDGALDGVAFQRKWERAAFAASGDYAPPAQLLGDFKAKKVSSALREVTPSCKRGYKFADINSCLPPYVCKTIVQAADIFAKKIPVFNSEGSVLSGVETRTSSPVRIMRDEKCDSSVYGLMPCGEGAGYAGGITSSAADGIRVALACAGIYI